MSKDNLTFVLHSPKDVRLEQTPIPDDLGPTDVLIQTLRVGICGSDVHYWQSGRIGPFILTAPMILGEFKFMQLIILKKN